MEGEVQPPRVEVRVSRLIEALEDGDRSALDSLLSILYEDLRQLSHRQRLRWNGDHTLQTTALLHETYLRLARQERISAENRAHFLALVSTAMRHVLINYAERRNALKRGGGLKRVPLLSADQGEAQAWSDGQDAAELLAGVDRALRALERASPRTGRVVECRFFGGLTVEETAAALDISPRTVKRDWAFAQAWLKRELEVAS